MNKKVVERCIEDKENPREDGKTKPSARIKTPCVRKKMCLSMFAMNKKEKNVCIILL